MQVSHKLPCFSILTVIIHLARILIPVTTVHQTIYVYLFEQSPKRRKCRFIFLINDARNTKWILVLDEIYVSTVFIFIYLNHSMVHRTARNNGEEYMLNMHVYIHSMHMLEIRRGTNAIKLKWNRKKGKKLKKYKINCCWFYRIRLVNCRFFSDIFDE